MLHLVQLLMGSTLCVILAASHRERITAVIALGLRSTLTRARHSGSRDLANRKVIRRTNGRSFIGVGTILRVLTSIGLDEKFYCRWQLMFPRHEPKRPSTQGPNTIVKSSPEIQTSYRSTSVHLTVVTIILFNLLDCTLRIRSVS